MSPDPTSPEDSAAAAAADVSSSSGSAHASHSADSDVNAEGSSSRVFDLTVIQRGLPSDGGAPFVGARLAPPGTKGKARAARTAPACGTVRALTPTPGVQGVPAPASTSRVVHAAAGAGFTDLGSRLEAWAGKGVPSMAPPPFLQPL